MESPFREFATMPGPLFLGLYGALGVAAVAGARLAVGRLDETEGLPLPAVPEAPEPYELAYLRAGRREVRRLLIFTLIERGYLRVADLEQHRVEQIARHPGLEHLDDLERCIFKHFAAPCAVRDVIGTAGRYDAVERRCTEWQARLDRERLVTPGPVRVRAMVICLAAFAALLGLAGSKLSVAVPNDLPTGLLLIATVGFALALLKIGHLKRLSRLGRAYVQRLRLAYDKLSLPLVRQPVGALPPALPVLIGLFGFSVLGQTSYREYAELFPKAPSGSSTDWSMDGDGGCGGCGCG